MNKSYVESVFKEYLTAFSNLEVEKKYLDRVREDCESLRAVRYDGVGGGGLRSPVESAIERMESAAENLGRKMSRNAEIVEKATEFLALIDDSTGEKIVRKRWFDGKKFGVIYLEMDISERTMYYHYNHALNEICEKYKSLQ